MVAITGRSDWNARRPKEAVVTVRPGLRTEFVIHHSGGPATQTVRAIQDWCMDEHGFNDIDYNFLVRGTTGEAYAGRGWDVVGSHTIEHNRTGIGVCIIGRNDLSAAAQTTVRALYQEAVRRAGHTLTVYGHRDLAHTDCPGETVYTWLRSGAVARPPTDPPLLRVTDPLTHSEAVRLVQLKLKVSPADGWYGPHTAAAVTAYQRAHGLTPDGVVGPLTWARLGLT